MMGYIVIFYYHQILLTKRIVKTKVNLKPGYHGVLDVYPLISNAVSVFGVTATIEANVEFSANQSVKTVDLECTESTGNALKFVIDGDWVR